MLACLGLGPGAIQGDVQMSKNAPALTARARAPVRKLWSRAARVVARAWGGPCDRDPRALGTHRPFVGCAF